MFSKSSAENALYVGKGKIIRISLLCQYKKGQISKIVHLVTGIRCGRVVSVGDFETGCPGFYPQSRYYGHGGVPLGKAHFLA